jgi:hypothetical protein
MSRSNRIIFLALIAALTAGVVTLFVQNRALQAQVAR